MSAETKSAGSQDVATIEQWDHDHVIHPQYAPREDDRPRVMVHGRGSRLVDSHGREYLDATGGLWLAQIGHGRRELAAAAQEQMEKLEYFASFWDFTNEPAARLARKLTELSGLAGVYFTTGGSESNEIAIMMARLFHVRHGEPERTVILARRKAYHGITFGARAATGLDAFHADVGPLPGDFVHLTPPEPYHMESCTDTCVAELEATIEDIGPHRIAAMIAEPVMGMAGMVAPPDDYWPRVSALLREHGILLIFDEVVTAYGRTGTWFAAEHWDVEPDIISTAKGLTSGYVPLGAVLVSQAVQDAVLEPPGFISGFTYNGHPTCCAVAIANLEIIEAERLLDNARETGSYLLAQLSGLTELDPVGDVRGFGMMLGIELVQDKTTKEPNVQLADRLTERFTEDTGVIIRSVANHLILSPPLVFTRDDCDEVVDAIRGMITKYAD
jgi:putrescine aminotransferase